MEKIEEISDDAYDRISKLPENKKKKIYEKISELKCDVKSYLAIISLRNSEDQQNLSISFNELEKSLSKCLDCRLDQFKDEILSMILR